MDCANKNNFTIVRLLQENVYDNKYDNKYDWKNKLINIVNKYGNKEAKVIYIYRKNEYDQKEMKKIEYLIYYMVIYT